MVNVTRLRVRFHHLRQGLAAVVLAGLCTSGAVHAHGFLGTSVPPADGTVRTAPDEVVITFTEPLEAALSGVTVTDADGQRVDLDDAAVDADAPEVLRVGLGPLEPGLYSVHWSVTSVDTHRTEGTFDFTVQP